MTVGAVTILVVSGILVVFFGGGWLIRKAVGAMDGVLSGLVAVFLGMCLALLLVIAFAVAANWNVEIQ